MPRAAGGRGAFWASAGLAGGGRQRPRAGRRQLPARQLPFDLIPVTVYREHDAGAIANALDTLVKHGEAEVATEKPRRFRRAAPEADDADGADGADGAEQDGTGLAGAA